jgi:hypothetical protein
MIFFKKDLANSVSSMTNIEMCESRYLPTNIYFEDKVG